jgi:signal peptidase I
MDLNFPLILVILVFGSGLIWLLDTIFFARGRNDDASDPILVEYARSFFPVLLFVLILRSFLVEPFKIPSSSMVPTLTVGDYILVNKYTYGIRLPVVRTKVFAINQPKRGDVMVFFPPHLNDTYFIKRVIGLPGDEIRYLNKQLTVNGELVGRELLAELPPGNPRYQLWDEGLGGIQHQAQTDLFRGQDNFQVTVAPDHYFMMGDNRDNSSDSRVWGQVPEKDIVGKAFAVWLHWESFFSMPSFKRAGSIQ